ncbi:MAG: hypothetical protein ACI8S3_000350 [Alphaproteobacteria bacterium]|jgi:uncharacterized protein (TIGR02186 family)
MRTFLRIAILLLLAMGMTGASAQSQTTGQAPGQMPNQTLTTGTSALVADLSDDLIAITTGFTGTEVLLFGATEGVGDIIVVVRAPESQVVVRRKGRVGGIWINGDSLVFEKVPGFYHVAASRPLVDLLPDTVLKHEQIGAVNLSVNPLTSASQNEVSVFAAALIRNKQRVGLFNPDLGEIKFLSNRLFRTQVEFPSSVPIGEYTATIYLVIDGAIIDRTDTPLLVRKTGFEANVFEFANQHPSFYGVIAILIALAAGWFAGIVFRNV